MGFARSEDAPHVVGSRYRWIEVELSSRELLGIGDKRGIGFLREHDGRGAGLEGGKRIRVAVALLACEGDEQRPGSNLARIDDRRARHAFRAGDDELRAGLSCKVMC